MTARSWLEQAAQVLGLDLSTARELERELEPDLVRLGLDPARLFLAPRAEQVTYDASGAGSIEADLVGPDNMGHEVAISVACASHPGEKVDLARPIPPGCTVRARWTMLPEASLAARYGAAPRPFLQLPPELAARVDWGHVVWPEVRVHVDLVATGGSPEVLVSSAVAGAMSAWERTGEVAIEYASPPRPSGPHGFEVSFDFGAAPTRALAHVLAELGRALAGSRFRVGV